MYKLSREFPNDLRLPKIPHGIFAAGGAYVPTQEKKKKRPPKIELW